MNKVGTKGKVRFTYSIPCVPTSYILVGRLPPFDDVVAEIKNAPEVAKLLLKKKVNSFDHFKTTTRNKVGTAIWNCLSKYFIRCSPEYNLAIITEVCHGANSFKNPSGCWIDEVCILCLFCVCQILIFFLVFELHFEQSQKRHWPQGQSSQNCSEVQHPVGLKGLAFNSVDNCQVGHPPY